MASVIYTEIWGFHETQLQGLLCRGTNSFTVAEEEEWKSVMTTRPVWRPTAIEVLLGSSAAGAQSKHWKMWVSLQKNQKAPRKALHTRMFWMLELTASKWMDTSGSCVHSSKESLDFTSLTNLMGNERKSTWSVQLPSARMSEFTISQLTPCRFIENNLKQWETTTNWSTWGDQVTKNFFRGWFMFFTAREYKQKKN